MWRAKYLAFSLMLPSLLACEVLDHESPAQKWMAMQKSGLRPPGLAQAPEIVDTPPAAYTAIVHDPFDPNRISARSTPDSGVGKQGVLFPDVSISSLSIVGFITAPLSGRVAVVRSGSAYRSIRQGDRLGEQAAMVKQIDGQGLLLEVDGGASQWLLRDK